nr:MAG TPA: SH3 domain protein [Caudoviricetes sp.]
MGKNYYSMYDKEKKADEKPVKEEKATVDKAPSVHEEKRTAVKKAQVVDCVCLNIRAMPDMQAKILSVVNAGTEIVVDEKSSDKSWCSVTLPNGQEGHAMRKFLKIL